MVPVTAWTVGPDETRRATLGTVLRGAATMLTRRPGLAFAAGLPEFVYGIVDVWWLENLPEQYVWVSLLAFPVAAMSYGWTMALLAAAWEARETGPLSVALGKLGALTRLTLIYLVVFLVGLPLILPALYYVVHYFYAPVLLLRDPARRSFALLRRSKLLARQHRLATWTLALLSVGWNAAMPILFDGIDLDFRTKAVAQALAVVVGNLVIAALTVQAVARWKAVDTARA